MVLCSQTSFSFPHLFATSITTTSSVKAKRPRELFQPFKSNLLKAFLPLCEDLLATHRRISWRSNVAAQNAVLIYLSSCALNAAEPNQKWLQIVTLGGEKMNGIFSFSKWSNINGFCK